MSSSKVHSYQNIYKTAIQTLPGTEAERERERERDRERDRPDLKLEGDKDTNEIDRTT